MKIDDDADDETFKMETEALVGAAKLYEEKRRGEEEK